jgi:hypothetical protein
MIDPHPPEPNVPDPSQLSESVLETLEKHGVDTKTCDSIIHFIEMWETIDYLQQFDPDHDE